MQKVTIELPAEIVESLRAEAWRFGCSVAEMITGLAIQVGNDPGLVDVLIEAAEA